MRKASSRRNVPPCGTLRRWQRLQITILLTDDELNLVTDKSLNQGVREAKWLSSAGTTWYKNVTGTILSSWGSLVSQNDIVEGTHPCTKDRLYRSQLYMVGRLRIILAGLCFSSS